MNIQNKNLKILNELMELNLKTLNEISKEMGVYEKSQFISMFMACLQDGLNKDTKRADVGIYDRTISRTVYPKKSHNYCDWDELLLHNKKEC